MGRPQGSIHNLSVCLTPKTWKLLTTTARLLATKRVSAEELISVGFWKVARYTERPENMVGRLRREMLYYIRHPNPTQPLLADDVNNIDYIHCNEERLCYRTEYEFEQWSRHKKYKIQR